MAGSRINRRRGTWLVVASAAAWPVALDAQQESRAVTGIVVDSATLQPLSYASVYTTTVARTFLTGEGGLFRLDSLPAGRHTITFRRRGYVTRSYAFTIDSADVGTIDIGAVTLARGPEPATTLRGQVRSNFGLAVARAAIMLDGLVLGVAGDDGRFAIDTVSAGLHLLEVRRIGYRPTLSEIVVADVSEDLNLNVTLEVLPLQLEEIVVSAERSVLVPPRLADFYDRRANGFGTYITKWDIEEEAPMYVTDALRRAPGVMVSPSGFGNSVRILRGGACVPSVYIDGMRMTVGDIDAFLRPEDVHGIEVYTSTLSAPMQYSSMFRTCGVVLIWTN